MPTGTAAYLLTGWNSEVLSKQEQLRIDLMVGTVRFFASRNSSHTDLLAGTVRFFDSNNSYASTYWQEQ